MEAHFLQAVINRFQFYKKLGDDTMAQLSFEELQKEPAHQINSVAIIVRHLHGNMRSRWTDFLTSDGEKSWRHRDSEFEGEYATKEALLEAWEAGWAIVFDALTSLQPEDVNKAVYIRKAPHTVMEAILRQLGHYSYHVGQIVYLGKLWKGDNWQSLSIPRGQSEQWRNQ